MAKHDSDPFDVESILVDEFKLLHHGDVGDGTLRTLYEKIHGLVGNGEGRSALCLSGGGIRSASFGLGVLQALARRDLLFKFHYLSTVSGGGYIGGWLTAWRSRLPDRVVQARLTSNEPDLYDEYPELAELRANSNYLTPKLGVMSADTWTLAALYIRNLLLNWLIFLPAIVSVLMVPVVAYCSLGWAKQWDHASHLWLAGVSLLLVLLALTVSVSGRFEKGRRVTQRGFLWFILVPTYLGAALLAPSVVSKQEIRFSQPIIEALRALPEGVLALLLSLRLIAQQPDGALIANIGPSSGALIGAMLYFVAWVLAFVGRKLFPAPKVKREDKVRFPWGLLLAWTIAGAVAGCLVAVGYRLAAGSDLKLIVILGVGWIALSMFLAESIYLGLASYASDGDVNREWLARSSGWFVAFTVGWALLAAIVLYAHAIQDWVLALVAAIGAGSGIAGSWIGSSAKTLATVAGKRVESLPMTTILSLATMVFLAALAIVISNLLPTILCTAYSAWTGNSCFSPPARDFAGMAVAVILACVFACLLIAYFVNVNRFSSHAIYRNRLIRAFLGAARARAEKESGAKHAVPKKSPTRDPFTGFDAEDNPEMATLIRPTPTTERQPRLFHVVNMALNVVGGQNLAWQERKAESFIATPLVCGNDSVGFRSTSKYASTTGGLTLGTAIAISGAAASPNQGYHSSPLVGLLMALFNVRLGWWLGNPSRAGAASREGPRWGIVQIVQELFQLTTNRSKYIYLSDGGHFENLGIYEMVRRRCHLIVASDAGADPDCAFEDLGNAVRKVWIDFGVKIDFHKIDIKKRDVASPGLYCAIGTIKYPEDGAKDGYLLYLKPGFPSDGSLPADVTAYGLANPAFPHETTADQFFSESQMESYRSLGSHIIDVVFGTGSATGRPSGPTTAISPFWGSIEKYVRPKPAVDRETESQSAKRVMGPGDQWPRRPKSARTTGR